MFTTLFYQPVLNLLIVLYNVIPGHDFGLAVIGLTIIIKLLLYPLSQHTIKSQKELQEVQPKIEELKKTHKDNKEALAKATMELYREHKINPFSSCLPLLIQLPFLFAVFQVFQKFGQNLDQSLVYSFVAKPEFSSGLMFLNYIDLSQNNLILAALAALAQFLQTNMMMNKQPKQQPGQEQNIAAIMNKQMLYMMPILTLLIGSGLPGGLTLYWFVFSALSALQQFYVLKKNKQTV
jgi:YidC/Oxa1 family membrane protein insertase